MADNNIERVLGDVFLEVATGAEDPKSKLLASLEIRGDKQPDLQYIKAILVSTGTNKNGAVFMPSELLKAEGSVPYKAIDLKHDQQSVIGHMQVMAMCDKDYNMISSPEMKKMIKETLKSKKKKEGPSQDDTDEEDMWAALDELHKDSHEPLHHIDIAVGGILYKERFPEISREVAENAYKVSMEVFYRNYDLKLGQLILSRDEADALGYLPYIGKVVNVKSGDKDLGKFQVGRVLRSLTFGGMGLVYSQANERSVIMEAAALKEELANHVPDSSINFSYLDSEQREKAESAFGILSHNTVIEVASPNDPDKQLAPLGSCPHFSNNHHVLDDSGKVDDAGKTPVQKHWCKLFSLGCPAFAANQHNPECWINVIGEKTFYAIDDYLKRSSDLGELVWFAKQVATSGKPESHFLEGPGNTWRREWYESLSERDKSLYEQLKTMIARMEKAGVHNPIEQSRRELESAMKKAEKYLNKQKTKAKKK